MTIADRRPPCSPTASPSPHSRTSWVRSPPARDRAASISAWASRAGGRGSSKARSRAATGSPCPRTRGSSSTTPTRRSGIGRWPSGGSASRSSPARGCVPAIRRAWRRSPSTHWRLGDGGELAVHAEGPVDLAGEDERAGGGDGHLDLDRFLGQDVAIELARNGDVVQRAGLVLDAEAQTLPRLAAQEGGTEIVVVCFHLHHAKRANVTRAVIGKGDAADGERLRLGARARG